MIRARPFHAMLLTGMRFKEAVRPLEKKGAAAQKRKSAAAQKRKSAAAQDILTRR